MEISSKRKLSVILSQIKDFETPKTRLEQYKTDSEIAAEIVWNAFYRREIEEKTIADLGCGTGMLGLSTLLLGAKKVFFVDIDEKAIDIAKKNLEFLEEKLDIELKNKAIFVIKDIALFDEKTDLILQNPPFGIQGKTHADKAFLETSFKLAPIIYSFHKAESKSFVSKLSDDKGYKITDYWEFDWPLKQTMKFHKKKIQYIKVGCWRLEKT